MFSQKMQRIVLANVVRRSLVARRGAPPQASRMGARSLSSSTIIPGAASGLSSIAEPNPSLFSSSELGSSAPAKSKVDSVRWRKDVRAMGSVLGQIIRGHEGEDIFNKVEVMRNLAKEWREEGAGRTASSKGEESFASLVKFASSLSNSELFTVSRAFTHFLSLVNAAEGHNRARTLKEQTLQAKSLGALSPKSDSCGGVLSELLEENDDDTIYQALINQTVELVLTAHPTEVNRRTIIDKHRRVQELLTNADLHRATGRLTAYEESQFNDAMKREIESMWQSDEVARSKPSPQVEAERGTLVVETVLWEALPKFLRKLSATMEHTLKKELPLDAAPIKFASWMGGDRDGNPNVTADVTREVCLSKRANAAALFAKDLLRLRGELSINNCSDEMREAVGKDAREPYRRFLDPMVKKLELTEAWARQELNQLHKKSRASNSERIAAEDIYLSRDDLMEELKLIYRSLSETGNETTAKGFLTDIMRNLSAFGLTLVPLDVRQESDRHTEALDAITRFLGVGSYAEWDEQTRITWIQKQLSSNRPLIRPGDWNARPDIFSDTAVDTLETFRMISEQHPDSLGAYVISQATSCSDVLAVLILQRDAGVTEPLRVVPLFETLDDLNGAEESMERLFSLAVYKGSIGGKQEVMIGYSDSAKDAGRLAASWAQYETQEKLAAVARKHGIEMTFFHGKGGTVGRGGNPATFNAILSHAPDTINGRFRVTEQGEMINQNFGHGDRAERTMDIYTAAVLAELLRSRPKPTQEWRDMMGKLSDISCNAYRKIVREDQRFVPYFRSATPELELSSLKIGSRPAKRKATGGVESLRAIPWNFSWTQTRLNLPTWLGVGEAFEKVMQSEDADKLLEMYEKWGSFRTTVDLVEMVLAKSEPSIARHYDEMLVKDEKSQELGEEVRGLHLQTENAVLKLSGHTTLSEDNTLLRSILEIRNPFVDCLNVLQAETLKRLREGDEAGEDQVLKDSLLTTITGVANGMGNTG